MDHVMNNASSCPVLFSLPYETTISYHKHLEWLRSIHSYAIGTVPVYLMVIFFGTRMMENRKPINLKWQLFSWNLFLAIFSMIGAARLVQEFFHVLTTYDVYCSVCITGPCNIRGFWISAFALSKIFELGDTVFLILRKRPVIFLHWYHHVSVLLFTWTSAVESASFGRYFMGINFMIHSLMYTYYAIQSIGYKLGRGISMTITTLQILQMIAGIFVVVYANTMIRSGIYCEVKDKTITIALVIYASYFVLFVKFFYDAYILSGANSKKQNRSSCNSSSIEGKDAVSNGIKPSGGAAAASSEKEAQADPLPPAEATTASSPSVTGKNQAAGKESISKLDRNQNYLHQNKKLKKEL